MEAKFFTAVGNRGDGLYPLVAQTVCDQMVNPPDPTMWLQFDLTDKQPLIS